ncbi:MAG: ATP-dependent Clp protease ATP-binding subunit ClpX, partial [Myxococcaceae bacterium]|nr:ATP-dependent Clp protease ATP-binding subunit ClpX [Myxococcaceae bacterium]
RRLPLRDDVLVHHHLLDAAPRGDVVHDVEHRVLEDGPEAARAGLAHERFLRDRLERALGDLELHAVHLDEALIDILTKPKNALVKQFQKMFDMDGVKLKFTKTALSAVAKEALIRNAGARGLRAILEHAMLDIMYDVPSRSGIKEVVINEEVITKGEAPLIVYTKEAELA